MIWCSFWKTFNELNYVNPLIIRYEIEESGKLLDFPC